LLIVFIVSHGPARSTKASAQIG